MVSNSYKKLGKVNIYNKTKFKKMIKTVQEVISDTYKPTFSTFNANKNGLLYKNLFYNMLESGVPIVFFLKNLKKDDKQELDDKLRGTFFKRYLFKFLIFNFFDMFFFCF